MEDNRWYAAIMDGNRWSVILWRSRNFGGDSEERFRRYSSDTPKLYFEVIPKRNFFEDFEETPSGVQRELFDEENSMKISSDKCFRQTFIKQLQLENNLYSIANPSSFCQSAGKVLATEL